jgi:hypothetical protein
MNFKQGDIITRNTGDTPTVWLSQRFVIDVCGVSESYLRTKARKDTKIQFKNVTIIIIFYQILAKVGVGQNGCRILL